MFFNKIYLFFNQHINYGEFSDFRRFTKVFQLQSTANVKKVPNEILKNT
jgi:hypothetical protein